MAELLTDDQISAALSDLPGWKAHGKALVRAVAAPDFRTGIRLVDDVAEVAEELNHHPDIDIRWTTVTFSLSTHSRGGVTQNDVTLARRIDALIAHRGAS